MSEYERKNAVMLAEMGVPVYPLAEKTTVPLKGSHGYKDATTNIDQINSWFGDRNTHLNVGMALKPMRLLVLDVDVNHESMLNGKDSLDELVRHYGVLPQPTYVMGTPRGGLHWFFKYPDGIEIPSKPLKDFKPELSEYTGIDIQTNGTPGRLTETRNGTYRVYQTGVDSPLDSADCPQWLLSMLVEKQTNRTPSKVRKTWAGKVIDSLFQPKASNGNRNVALTSLCGRLVRTGADSQNVYEALFLANSRIAEPLPDKEVNQIFRSVLRRENRK